MLRSVPRFKTSQLGSGVIFLEKKMIRSWTHTNLDLMASAAFRDMRTGRGLAGEICVRIADTNYQPKPSGMNRLESKV
jgi:hypothetical protein